MAKLSERERLSQLIQQWNVDHYDLFELSAPNQDLEFHGVVRFYFQGGEGANVITKCIRVSSTATTADVIDTLIEKFRPDMRMLEQNKYALYEVHVNGEERKLKDGEKPLWVQLNWGKDVREGRFLLKNENEKTIRDPALGFKEPAKEEGNFKRKLSKREKKEKKKRDEELAKQNESVSSKLYNEAPESSFTRSISNPEAVMRRRRQQKLEKKLAQMQSREGGPDSGGTLKIYGESLQPDVPYKTLLLSTADTTAAVIKEAMEKYGLEKEDPEQFCLVEVLLPPGSQEYHGGNVGEERVLDDGECPLALVMQHPKQRGHLIFQLRRRAADLKKRSKRPRAVSHDDLRKAHHTDTTQADKLPYLLELNPINGPPQKHLLPLNVTEVVGDRPKTQGNQFQFLLLASPDIRPRHCVIAHTEGIVTITPTTRDAEILVENRRIQETTMMRHGMTVQFGKNHRYRFVDPRIEEVPQKGHPVPAPRSQQTETNFDVDGHVETVSRSGAQFSRPIDRDQSQGRMAPAVQVPNTGGYDGQGDQLPASLEYRLELEDRLLQAVILEVNSRAVQFKLAPTYTLYLAVRRLLLARQQMGMEPSQHAQMMGDFVSKTSKLIQQAIQEHHNDPTALAFWMANASEVLHFFKQDYEVQPFGVDSQELLAEAVQMAFHHLVRCLQNDLQRVMPSFLDASDFVEDENVPQDQYQQGPVLADVLNTLSAAMTLLRRCRVNAALTIQLFSQLFHFINMWLFNILVLEPELQLCTRAWGLRLKRRLSRVEVWAEKQGLELAADCHLCRIIQAAHMLTVPKSSSDDVTNITAACFKLNSVQLQALLTRYIPDSSEPPVTQTFIDRVVVIAENMADELTRTDGREVRLEEDPDLHLPFLLPEDGYSCDTIRGIPNGLPEFVSQLGNVGLCHMVANQKASGSWTVYMGGQLVPNEQPMKSPQRYQPEIMIVSFKKVKGSMGLSIVAAVGEGVSEKGIYIKSVVPGGAAALDGRLKAGDQLLEVDGRSLVGLSQDKAAELMTQTGEFVTLRVAKQGAIYHGLATLLSEPSPTMPRRAVNKNEEGPPPYNDSPTDTGRSRPVPQPRSQGSRAENLDRMKSPSAGNLTQHPQQQQQYTPRHQGPSTAGNQPRDFDPRSKSTSNLHVNTSFEPNDMHAGMRGAASVGMLQHNAPGYPQYSPGSRRLDNNYENQPQVSPGSGQGSYSQDINQNIKTGSMGMGPPASLHATGYRSSDRSSVSSRASSNSAGREQQTRPQSAYYGDSQQPAREDINSFSSRPKSEEVTSSKLKEWQDKYEPHGHPGHSPQYANQNPGYMRSENGGSGAHSPPYINQIFPPSSSRPSEPAVSQPPQFANQGQNHSPPYTNIGAVAQQQNRPAEPKPSARDRLFGPGSTSHLKSGAGQALQRPTQQQQTPPQPQLQLPPQQLPVYEISGQQEPQQPFQRLPSDSADGKPKPSIKPKPSAMKKPIQAKPMDNVQPNGQYGAQAGSQSQQYPGDFKKVPDSKNVPQLDRRTVPQQDARSMQDPRNLPQQDFRALPDSRNMPQQDPRTMPDPRNMPQQDLRALPDSRNMPQQDLRTMPDPRNMPQQDLRTMPDPRGMYDPRNPDPRTLPDPRNMTLQDLRNMSDPRSYPQYDLRDNPDARSFATEPRTAQVQVQDPRGYNMQKFPSLRGDPGPYGYPASRDGPPELPPPPSDDHEELPPLPPPPQDFYDQAQEEQQRLLEAPRNELIQHTSVVPPYASYGQQPQPTAQGYNDLNRQSDTHNRMHPISPAVGVPLSSFNQPQPPNYQNINFVSEVRADAGPAGQVPVSRSEYVYEQYATRPPQPVVTPPTLPQGYGTKPASLYLPGQQLNSQQQQQPPQPSPLTPGGGLNKNSAWDREEREKAEAQQAEELFQLREQEIAELESRSYLSIQDQERLRKLKLEHEFQRRVREVDEKGDYDADEDDEIMERLFTRERLIQSLKDDVEKSKQKIADFDNRQMMQDMQLEKERMQRLERRLEVMEKDRQEMRERMERRTQRRAKDHQEQLRQQREAREKQRQNYEEQKRLLVIEEEKMRQRREEEINKRRQMERERQQELQMARDQEELRLRQEVRRENDDYITQQMLQQRQQRQMQNREIRVSEEHQRLESLSGAGRAQTPASISNALPPSALNNGLGAKVNSVNSQGYQQYMNLPPVSPEKENQAPPPPERKSSYNIAPTRNNLDYASLNYNQPPPQQEPPPTHLPPALKKTVKFNTDMNTYQERTPSHSFSSEHNVSPVHEQGPPGANDVFSQLQDQTPPSYQRSNSNSSMSTPVVIGSQEVYRDPRSRIEAQKAAQGGGNTRKQPAADRMSFRDKMKYFAQEAGEEAPKYKPKASKTLRNIESQLNGQ